MDNVDPLLPQNFITDAVGRELWERNVLTCTASLVPLDMISEVTFNFLLSPLRERLVITLYERGDGKYYARRVE